MNDPGLDGPVGEAAQANEQDPYRDQFEYAAEEDQQYLNPSRWWFASTACPLIAGTFGPIANALSICALVENWRVYVPPGSSEGYGIKVPDPAWLIAINTISLAAALIANFALLLNMAQRVRFEIAQPITILGFFVSGFLLIALLIAASTDQFKISPQHALTQAFYYAIMAAINYLGVTFVMCITVYGAHKEKFKKGFKLTPSQRTLMLQTISFMVYLLLGALIYSYVENWAFLDAVFWADFTLLTVGIGEPFVPLTHTGRALLFPYAIGGIVMLGLVVGSIRTLVLERGKQKIQARMTEKKRQHALKSVNLDKQTIRVDWLQILRFSKKGKTESQLREQEFKVMRAIQYSAESRRKWLALGVSVIAAFTLWLVGAVIFWQSEQPQSWSYFVALYFAYTSLMTIGYGDFTPMSNSGKAFFVYWSLLAVPTLTILISNMGDTVVKTFSEATNWLGSITVLPGETGFKANLKSAVAKLTGFKVFRNVDITIDGHTNSTGTEHIAQEKATRQRNTADVISEKIAKHLESQELREAQQAESHGDMLERDINFYHFVLAKEVRNLMKDVHASPAIEYSYPEWAYYLKLIGQDEDNPNLHRTPQIKADKRDDPGLEQSTAPGRQGAIKMKRWSWLGNQSPLMGEQSEAQWILEKLSATLELELKRMRSQNPQERYRPPPISMSELVSGPEKESNDGSPMSVAFENSREKRD
ncbi:MAG: Potassium channel [Bathelium mastoideum]|nr:MAG: Potassium channel [Bathelium mastoideum]